MTAPSLAKRGAPRYQQLGKAPLPHTPHPTLWEVKIHTVHGQTHGLKPSHTKALEKLYARRVEPAQFISPELARSLTALTHDTGRAVGLLLDRGGHVTAVAVGNDAKRIYLPDLGRARAGASRLRSLRLVAAFPNGPLAHLPHDLLTDLQKLQLDGVMALGVDPAGLPGTVAWAHLLPLAQDQDLRYRLQQAASIHALELDFVQFIEALEQELTREADTRRHARSAAVRQDRAVLIGVYSTGRLDAQASMDELQELAQSAGVDVAQVTIQLRRQLDPRTVLGKGKLEEVVLGALRHGADFLVFDRDLSPSQLNHITTLTELKVLDRTMLILDIFAQRARTTDGKLQVELAQLKYSLPRLAQRQSGMSRLTGGIGGRGPGETRLEIDKRRAKDRIARLEKQLERVAGQRMLRRSGRKKDGLPVISIVGYTNAGKSTLLNALTKSDVFTANRLFATLDPVSRRLRFPHEREVIITDTVGFIRDLPKDLVNAFKATLEELGEADLLLHVVDASDPEHPRHLEAVEKVLEALEVQSTPRILVLNKMDRVPEQDAAALCQQRRGMPVSAMQQLGLPQLLNACAQQLWRNHRVDDSVWEKVTPVEENPPAPMDPPTQAELKGVFFPPPHTPAAPQPGKG